MGNESFECAKTLSEIDTLALGFMLGKVKISDIKKLNIIDQCQVLNLAALYSCTRLGTISRNACCEGKYETEQMARQMRTEIYFLKQEHLQWIDRTKKFSTKLCDFAKALRNKETNALQMACEIIDLLTRDDIYNKMFVQIQSDEHFKENCLQTLKDTENFMFLHFGNVPYVDLLFKFYDTCNESRITEIYSQLDDDSIKKRARKDIPLKNDDIKGIVKSYKELLKIK